MNEIICNKASNVIISASVVVGSWISVIICRKRKALGIIIKFSDESLANLNCKCVWLSSRFLKIISIAVINELEGLCRGVKPLTSAGIDVSPSPSTSNSRAGSRNNPNHAAFVVQASKAALVFLKAKNPAVK